MTDWYFNGRKGAQGELIAAIDLMDQGFEVFRAVDPVASTDLIAHHKGRSWRIQVKSGSPATTEVKPDKQEIVAWVNVRNRTVRYEPGLPLTTKAMPEDTDADRFARATATKIADCVKRGNGTTEWIAQFRCWHKGCDIRTFEIYVKEFDYDPPHVRGPFKCPNCSSAVELEWAKTGGEWWEVRDRQARQRVNRQRYEREHCDDEHQLVAIPGDVFCDDSLCRCPYGQ